MKLISLLANENCKRELIYMDKLTVSIYVLSCVSVIISS